MTADQSCERQEKVRLLPPPGCTLVQADGELARQAIGRVIAPNEPIDSERVNSFLSYADLRQLDLSHTWCVLEGGGKVIAAALAIPAPGRAVMMFASEEKEPRSRRAGSCVIERASRSVAGAVLAQVLIEPDEAEQQSMFMEGGFQRLTTLSYMQRPLPTRPPAAIRDWPAEVSIISWQELQSTLREGNPARSTEKDCEDETRREFIAALDASYEQTRDCPGLKGIRTTEDVLAGHLDTGEFDPSLWTMVRFRDEPAGVLLFSYVAERQAYELVYIGLAPSVRGKGVASRLLQHGLRQLCGRPGRYITLAVDEENQPALKLYKKLGFAVTGRRTALIRNLNNINDE